MDQVTTKMEEGLQAVKGFQIQQGPGLLRFLALGAALASLVCAVWQMVHVTQAIAHPVMYILYGYISLFALTTMLFESKPEWVEKMGPLSKYQNILIRRC